MLCLAKNSPTCRATGHSTLSRCRSEELVKICEVISNKIYLEGIARLFHEKSDSCCALGEVVYVISIILNIGHKCKSFLKW